MHRALCITTTANNSTATITTTCNGMVSTNEPQLTAPPPHTTYGRFDGEIGGSRCVAAPRLLEALDLVVKGDLVEHLA